MRADGAHKGRVKIFQKYIPEVEYEHILVTGAMIAASLFIHKECEIGTGVCATGLLGGEAVRVEEVKKFFMVYD